MSRTTATVSLGVCLALGSGLAWFGWEVYAYGASCGDRLPGHPSGPTTTGFIVLVAVPGLIVLTVHGLQSRKWIRAAGYGALVALVAFAAVAVGFVAFFLSRHCNR
jgi:drug/metabolite transporter (DMT)-like permease